MMKSSNTKIALNGSDNPTILQLFLLTGPDVRVHICSPILQLPEVAYKRKAHVFFFFFNVILSICLFLMNRVDTERSKNRTYVLTWKFVY